MIARFVAVALTVQAPTTVSPMALAAVASSRLGVARTGSTRGGGIPMVMTAISAMIRSSAARSAASDAVRLASTSRRRVGVDLPDRVGPENVPP